MKKKKKKRPTTKILKILDAEYFWSFLEHSNDNNLPFNSQLVILFHFLVVGLKIAAAASAIGIVNKFLLI